MPERTEKDEAIDEAIERLISEDMEGFTVVTKEGEDCHIVHHTENARVTLLGLYLHVETLQRMMADRGSPIGPYQLLEAAIEFAGREGYLDDPEELPR